MKDFSAITKKVKEAIRKILNFPFRQLEKEIEFRRKMIEPYYRETEEFLKLRKRKKWELEESLKRKK